MLIIGIFAPIAILLSCYFVALVIAFATYDGALYEPDPYNDFYEKYKDDNSESWDHIWYNQNSFDSTGSLNSMVSCDGLFVLGADPQSSSVLFALVNSHDTDTLVYASRGSYIEDGASNKYYLSTEKTPTLALYPDYQYIKPHDTLCFFLDFDQFPRNADSLNFWFKPGQGILGFTFVETEE
jgi:hypothetical protein